MSNIQGGGSPESPREGQMFADEFIAEVIGIGRLDALHIDCYHREHTGDEQSVMVMCKLSWPDRDIQMFDGVGKTMGLALRATREQIRMQVGR